MEQFIGDLPAVLRGVGVAGVVGGRRARPGPSDQALGRLYTPTRSRAHGRPHRANGHGLFTRPCTAQSGVCYPILDRSFNWYHSDTLTGRFTNAGALSQISQKCIFLCVLIFVSTRSAKAGAPASASSATDAGSALSQIVVRAALRDVNRCQRAFLRGASVRFRHNPALRGLRLRRQKCSDNGHCDRLDVFA